MWSEQPRPSRIRYSELERIGEMFGVKDTDIPRFIRAVESAVTTVEDWHGQAHRTR